MKKIGVWLDNRTAYVVGIDEHNNEEIRIILSKEENRNDTKKAFRDKIKQGSKEVVKDRKLIEYSKQELKQYFKEIATELGDPECVVIFGPAEIPLKFKKELKSGYPRLHEKVIDVVKADSMTKNQTVALVRNYYSKPSSNL
jgi:hypothetical protein